MGIANALWSEGDEKKGRLHKPRSLSHNSRSSNSNNNEKSSNKRS